mgnify:CR=1 FL=1
MTIKFNNHVVISSGSSDLTSIAYKAVKEALIEKFGEKSIVLSEASLKPSRNGLWFANIYLNTDREVKEGAR